MSNNKLIEAMARALYEHSRKDVSGRPAWEHLDSHDAYDMGMQSRALDMARAALQAIEREGMVVTPGWYPWSIVNRALGQRVLILFERSGHIEDATIHEIDGDIVYCLFDGEQLNDAPTHWMPLPAAPQAGGVRDA